MSLQWFSIISSLYTLTCCCFLLWNSNLLDSYIEALSFLCFIWQYNVFFFIDCFLPVFTKLATAGLFLVSYCYLSTLYIASSPVCAEYEISSPDVCHLYPESLHLASTKPSMSIYSLLMVCSSHCCTLTALAFQDLMLVIDLTD